MLAIPCNVPGDKVASAPLAQPVAPATDLSASSASKNTLENNGGVDGVIAHDDCSGDDDTDDVMAVAIAYLEEDCRLLRAQK